MRGGRIAALFGKESRHGELLVGAWGRDFSQREGGTKISSFL